MKQLTTTLDLQFAGAAREVVLGTYSVGNDPFGEILGSDMEFAGDQPNPIS